MTFAPSKSFQTWKSCGFCVDVKFHTEQDLVRHLREAHGLIAGAYNGGCCSLTAAGVSVDDHVAKQHGDGYSRSRRTKQDSTREDDAFGARESGWSFYTGSQNLTSVLNDPNVGKQRNFFTQEWGEHFTDGLFTTNPRLSLGISWRDAEDHINNFSKLNKIHVANNIMFPTKPSLSSNLLENFSCLRTAKSIKETDHLDLSKIPKVFFGPNFHLGKQNIFDQVFVGSYNISRNSSTESVRIDHLYNNVVKGSRQSVQLLQVQLSHYLDVVEIQIAKQVSQQSDTFFQSVKSHDDLVEKLGKTIKIVKTARQKVHQIEDTFVQHSFNIFRLINLKRNYVHLYNKLKLMAIVKNSQSMIQSLLSASDYLAALDMILVTKDIVSHKLVLIQSLRYQISRLSEMEQTIDKILVDKFEVCITENVNHPFVNNGENYHKECFGQIVFGILRQKHFHCVDVYKNKVFKKIKEIVRMIEIEMIRACNSTVVGQFSLTDQLKCLCFPDWISFLKNITSKLLILIVRVKDTRNLIQQAIEKCAKRPLEKSTVLDASQHTFNLPDLVESFLSDTDFNKMSSKLNDLMISVCDFANHQVFKVVNSYWLVDKASASQFCNLGYIVDAFSEKCREICGRSSTSLHSAFTAQANKFVQTFHQERKGKLGLILNSECWKRVDVPTEFQNLVTEITQSGNFSIIKLNSLGSKPSNVLTVNNEIFMVVGAVLLLLKMTTEYCVCASELVTMAPSVCRYLAELLQFFNARTCQLLLGTTALHTAGLKSITSRNLSLASRDLQLLVCLLPYIRDHFQNIVCLNSQTGQYGSGIDMFELVKRDILRHEQEIQRKIISIINSLIVNQLNQWDASLPVPSKSFRNIAKQLRKLQEAIGDILPPLQLQEIYKIVHECFKVKLREQLNGMNIKNNTESRSTIVILEVEYFENVFEKLNIIPLSEINTTMVDIWVNI